MTKIIAIVQARMSSARLPGKSMLPLGDKSLVSRVLNRTSLSKSIDKTILSTSLDISDDILEYEAKKNGFEVYRGSLDNVLDRFYQTSKLHNADIIVRICADNAFVSPEIIDLVINRLIEEKMDYASTMLKRTFPAGVNTEAFTFKSFHEVWKKSTTDYQKEHVTPLYYDRNRKFKFINIEASGTLKRPEINLSIDNFKDYLVVSKIYENITPERDFISIDEAIKIGDQLNLWKINGPPTPIRIQE